MGFRACRIENNCLTLQGNLININKQTINNKQIINNRQNGNKKDFIDFCAAVRRRTG